MTEAAFHLAKPYDCRTPAESFSRALCKRGWPVSLRFLFNGLSAFRQTALPPSLALGREAVLPDAARSFRILLMTNPHRASEVLA